MNHVYSSLPWSVLRVILERPLLFTPEYFSRFGHGKILEESFVRLHLNALYASGRKPKSFWDALRNRKLKRLLRVAARLPFWKDRIRSDILATQEPLPQLCFLPITTKDDLQSVPLEEKTHMAIATKYGTLNYTSGSTGEPLSFFTDRRLRVRIWALLWRIADLYEVSQQSVIHLWPTPNPNFSFKNHFYTKTMEELREQRQRIYTLLLQPKSIVLGFPSLLRFLVEEAQQDGVTLRPDVVILAGEALTPEMRLFLQDRLQSRIVNHYGCREISVMAGQCEYDRFHESGEDVVFEVVSEERGIPLKEGKVGRLIVTGLNSHIAPFIRYSLGDYGFFYEDLCPCGNPMPAFNFEGRTHDVTPISLPDGSHISPYQLTGIFNRRFEKIRQYQINHYAPYSFIVYIIPTERYDPKDESELLADFRKVTKNSQVYLRHATSIGFKGPKVLPYIKSF